MTLAIPHKLAVAMLFFAAQALFPVSARDMGHGTVGVAGSIVETPCSIDPGSRFQVIEIGGEAGDLIVSTGRTQDRSFIIKLVSCVLNRLDPKMPNWQTFTITFNGKSGEDGNFGLEGKADGVSLQILDDKGNIAHPGIPMDPENIIWGDQELRYKVRLIGNAKALRVGTFSSSIRFQLNYF